MTDEQLNRTFCRPREEVVTELGQVWNRLRMLHLELLACAYKEESDKEKKDDERE